MGYTASDLRNRQQIIQASLNISESNKEEEIINLCIAQGKSASTIFKPLKGKRVIYTVFESNILPDGWKESLETADLVITASQWGAQILKSSLAHTPVEVVPEGIDINQFHHWKRLASLTSPQSREDKQEFRFLSIGKLEDRKGLQELLSAFQLAFATEKHVKLILKIHNPLDKNYLRRFYAILPREISDQVTLAKSDANTETMSTAEIARLYKSSHCFVFPSKAEGWGLPLLEAIACGSPYIATHYSGQTEYLKHFTQAYSRVDFSMEEINSDDFFVFHKFSKTQRPRWAKPDINSLASCMKNVYLNHEKLTQGTVANAQLARKLFSWRASTEALLDTLMKHFPQQRH